MKYFFDFDGTLCTSTAGAYETARPKQHRIDRVNKLHDEGHSITIFTARGVTTGIDHSELTRKQLADWGVKYDDLLQKPYYDLFVCDRAMSDVAFFGPDPLIPKFECRTKMCAYTGHAYGCNYHMGACDCPARDQKR